MMDREANLPPPNIDLGRPIINSDTTTETTSSSSTSESLRHAQAAYKRYRPIVNSDTTTATTSSSSSSSSTPEFFRHFQAAFKRHRPTGTMQRHNLLPVRKSVPQRDSSITAAASSKEGPNKNFHDVIIPSSQVRASNDSSSTIIHSKNSAVAAVRETQEDASITPPFISGTTITKTFEESFNPSQLQGHQSKSVIDCKENNNPMPSSNVEHVDCKRKVQFSMANNATSQEMEWVTSNPVEAMNDIGDELKHQNLQIMESDIRSRLDGTGSSLAKRIMAAQDQLHQYKHFLSQPATQSSVIGASCPTTTSIHSTSAPILNSTTYCSHSHLEGGIQVAGEPLTDFNASSHQTSQKNMNQLSCPSKDTSVMLVDPAATLAQASISAIDAQMKEHHLPLERPGSQINGTDISKNPSYAGENLTKKRGSEDGVADVQSQDPSSKNLPSDVMLESCKPVKQEKVTGSKAASMPHKKNYDPDLFYKVNGKLYQKLGKIGSGGSSEVHKVISSDRTIYALKKIKLKGRDYATAYGFCQEILYLNKLKGKSNIIQLVDYEVTDKSLLREVMNESMSNKDARVKDDGFIYMVLEHGEIDLAHMLSQKWKEMDSTKQTIDENWLRFYWQQILEAVNTIHEERIVHSDLKPANFLLVKGFLKLIDFGIAKAIMSDTTNIQRDSQVGTLSYMSPEAFMCNERDANGKTIKCGRSSDIWSLGCILYQMVYGRTPFAEYKTFWAKFKVITDPDHKITYEPVSNPWLLDLMKNCLTWDRNQRWRIPQLLQHPFIVPPIPTQQEEENKLLRLIAEGCGDNQEALKLCSDLRQLHKDPIACLTSESLLPSENPQCKLLSQMSMLCLQLKEHLSKLETQQK
ncbi:serine/threonine-protein kinase MPS1 isoform X2 [Mercurialis annua]|uniref:serine/threonine-protein kinase MPS1 isoform X2 n=1 Tax=Mercurialis annua TaxID=3986 RepID=UPI00215EE59F|nr:serine/threonine-protein kinase MPS1 isoform X2 [Mercurialis annua]